MIKTYFLSLKPETPKRGYWDMGFLEDLVKDFDIEEVSTLPHGESAIVVIPARHHAKLISRVNQELAHIKNVLLFLMGDEEGDFPIERIDHGNIKIWVQNPQLGRHDNYRKLGTGYPPAIHDVSSDIPDKKLDWMFAGQISHSRREEASRAMKSMANGSLTETKGFTQGLAPSEYYEIMKSAKVVPCPSGPETPDTFRLFEALELGCVPIADSKTPNYELVGFWEWLFDEPIPFPVLSEYDQLSGYTKDCVAKFPELNNDCQAWWIRYKRKLKMALLEDLAELGFEASRSLISVVIPISPIPSHPETSILEETINSALHHLPNSEIILTFDGVRNEQLDRRNDYNEHIRRVLWKFRDKNIVPYIFKEHKHQVGMMRAVLDSIKTPIILYMEQDTPLVTDYSMDWEKLGNEILSGEANVIRFHFEAFVPGEHKHMMIGSPEDELLKTVQWSQRPHLASVAFYRRILSENFTEKSNCFIEDLLHGRLHEDYIRDGILGWNQWRVYIYHPNGNIKRSYHTDGRAGDKKYNKEQVW